MSCHNARNDPHFDLAYGQQLAGELQDYAYRIHVWRVLAALPQVR